MLYFCFCEREVNHRGTVETGEKKSRYDTDTII